MGPLTKGEKVMIWIETTVLEKNHFKDVPGIYEQQELPWQERKIYLYLRLGGYHWFVAGYDGNDVLYGFEAYTSDQDYGEWKYFSLNTLLKKFDGTDYRTRFNMGWEPRKAGKIELIESISFVF